MGDRNDAALTTVDLRRTAVVPPIAPGRRAQVAATAWGRTRVRVDGGADRHKAKELRDALFQSDRPLCCLPENRHPFKVTATHAGAQRPTIPNFKIRIKSKSTIFPQIPLLTSYMRPPLPLWRPSCSFSVAFSHKHVAKLPTEKRMAHDALCRITKLIKNLTQIFETCFKVHCTIFSNRRWRDRVFLKRRWREGRILQVMSPNSSIHPSIHIP